MPSFHKLTPCLLAGAIVLVASCSTTYTPTIAGTTKPRDGSVPVVGTEDGAASSVDSATLGDPDSGAELDDSGVWGVADATPTQDAPACRDISLTTVDNCGACGIACPDDTNGDVGHRGTKTCFNDGSRYKCAFKCEDGYAVVRNTLSSGCKLCNCCGEPSGRSDGFGNFCR